ncbi:MAG: HAD family hydrolase [Clostridiales bacterium]|nr:HAD family hydrolase [Clostridiales bacterium]
MTIIFDLDGTLFQTEPNTASAIRRIAAECGADALTDAEILYALRLPPRGYYDYLKTRLNVVDFERFRTRLRELERASIRERGELFDGVMEMLQLLCDRGHTLEICSNGTMEYIDIVIGRTGIRRYFSRIVSAREYPTKAECLREMIHLNRNTVYIGDAGHDFEAAQANKLPFIAALYGYGSPDEFQGAAFEVNSPAKIANCILQMTPDRTKPFIVERSD